jgi:hypothetical protein
MFAPITENSRTDSAAWRRDREARRLRRKGSFSVSLWHALTISSVRQCLSGIGGVTCHAGRPWEELAAAASDP